MPMYGPLLRLCPPRLANIVLGLWYAVLILLIFFFAFEPQAEFRYMNI
jgi:hypothetical protein